MDVQKGIELSSAINVSNLISAFYYSFPADFTYKGEAHSGWEFVYVEQGKLRVQANESTYILKSGEMVCHKPMEFHKLEPYEGCASSIIFCFECYGECMQYFNDRILFINQRQKYYLNDIASHAKKIFYPKSPIDIAKDGVMDKKPDSEAKHEQFVKNTIELLILSLLSSISTQRQKRIECFVQNEQRLTLTTDIIQYLNDNMNNPIRLTDLSDNFQYSLSSIKRIFKAETGSGIIDYLNNLRIERATWLLCNTNLPIKEISRQTGFIDVYYFSNCFKKKTGKNPTSFRRNITG